MYFYYDLVFFWSVLSVLIPSVSAAAIPPVGEIPLLDRLRAAVAQLGELIIDPPDDLTLAPLRSSTDRYAITQNAPKPARRAAGIETKRKGFLYGPPVAGGPFFPAGPLGQAKAAVDQINIQRDLGPQLRNALIDDTNAIEDVAQYDGLDTLDDYTKLYDGQWDLTLPEGPVPGALTNYTDDLFFSMERLSISPYAVRRLQSSSYTLPFQVHAATVKRLTGMHLQQLLWEGRLFYSDYRGQSRQMPTARYAADCDAYFYISPKSGDFLPLAIRTNAGAGPIYTPLDNADDWLSAKIMYNADDFWFAQWTHLAQTHQVVQISYMAAIRTLSENHPMKPVLDRLMYEVFAVQPLAAVILFPPGGAVDQVFAYTGPSAQRFTTNQYARKGFGRFQANYFRTDLENRGLINADYQPELKHFPFYEDAGRIWDAIHVFMTKFVNSYYSSDAAVRKDAEIQNWAKEANGPAKALDFPRSISTRAILVDVLTHFAHLASNAHHTVNTNELMSISSTLPFHTASLYHPIPQMKPTGVKPVQYLPPFEKVIESLTVAALFARPLLEHTNRTVIHMFDDENILPKTNPPTRQAAVEFKRKMTAFSAQVARRTFDAEGLSQGMPFVWQALDPDVQLYSITV